MDVNKIARIAKEYDEMYRSTDGFCGFSGTIYGKAEVQLLQNTFFEAFGEKELSERWTGDMVYQTEIDGVIFFALPESEG